MSDNIMQPHQRVADALRKLADDVETGQYRTWEPNLTVERPVRELDPSTGECPIDGFRHCAAGDEITATLVLRRR